MRWCTWRAIIRGKLQGIYQITWCAGLGSSLLASCFLPLFPATTAKDQVALPSSPTIGMPGTRVAYRMTALLKNDRSPKSRQVSNRNKTIELAPTWHASPTRSDSAAERRCVWWLKTPNQKQVVLSLPLPSCSSLKLFFLSGCLLLLCARAQWHRTQKDSSNAAAFHTEVDPPRLSRCRFLGRTIGRLAMLIIIRLKVDDAFALIPLLSVSRAMPFQSLQADWAIASAGHQTNDCYSCLQFSDLRRRTPGT